MNRSVPQGLLARWALGYARFCANRDAATETHWSRVPTDTYASLEEPNQLLRALYLLSGEKELSGLDISDELVPLLAIDCSEMPVAMRFGQVLEEGVVSSILGNIEAAIAHCERALPLAATRLLTISRSIGLFSISPAAPSRATVTPQLSALRKSFRG